MNDITRITRYDKDGNKSFEERELTDGEQAEKDELTEKDQIKAQLLAYANLGSPSAAQETQATQRMARIIARHLN